MTQVLCAIDDRDASAEVTSEAITVALGNRADLTLVGVVRPTGAVQPGYGELLRRRRELDQRLRLAGEQAQLAGLTCTTAVRAGDPRSVLHREAQAVDSDDVLLVHARGRVRAPWRSRRRIDVAHRTAGSAGPSHARPRLPEAVSP
jgi:nucleotide-binding universal stress UspA family protein